MMALRAGFESYNEYYTAMERDAAVLAAFLDKMTINVSELLRNPPLMVRAGVHSVPTRLQMPRQHTLSRQK